MMVGLSAISTGRGVESSKRRGFGVVARDKEGSLWLGWLVAKIGWPLRCLLNYWQQGESHEFLQGNFPADVRLVFEGDATAVMALLDGVL